MENAEKVVNPPQNPITRKFNILFENESLKHRKGNTMRSNMYEVSTYI